MNTHGAEMRREVRYQVKGEIEGYFDLGSDNDKVPFKILNVSKSGMCVTTTKRLPEEPELTLVISKLVAEVFIAWMIPCGKPGTGFKYGLCAAVDNVDFVNALQQYGLLSENTMRTTTSDSEAFVDEFFLATTSGSN